MGHGHIFTLLSALWASRPSVKILNRDRLEDIGVSVPTLRFSDGVTIDTGGAYRITREIPDGLYVVGNGFFAPVKDEADAERMLAEVRSRRRAPLIGEPDVYNSRVTPGTKITRYRVHISQQKGFSGYYLQGGTDMPPKREGDEKSFDVAEQIPYIDKNEAEERRDAENAKLGLQPKTA
jgi:hypothetical protein